MPTLWCKKCGHTAACPSTCPVVAREKRLEAALRDAADYAERQAILMEGEAGEVKPGERLMSVALRIRATLAPDATTTKPVVDELAGIKGFEPKEEPQRCERCSGFGYCEVSTGIPFKYQCPSCHGTGKEAKDA